MAAKQLSDGNTDGSSLGQSASDKVGFHGVTPVVQQSVGSLVSSGTAITALTSAVLDIQNILKNYGLSS